MTDAEAWAIFCRRGVIPPGYAGTIARRRKQIQDWADAGEELR